MDLRITLLSIHAVSGIVAFFVGCLIFNPSHARAWLGFLYESGLAIMITAVMMVVAVEWEYLSGFTQWTYSGLVLLGLYTLWRGVHAQMERSDKLPGWQENSMNDIGFTLISLFEGFVIVGALDLGAPGWLAAVIAVTGVVFGVMAVNAAKDRIHRSGTQAFGH